MDEGEDVILDWHTECEEQKKKDNALLEQIKLMLTLQQCADLWEEICEGDASNFEIVETLPTYIEEQKNRVSTLRLWVEEKVGGGYSGDSYAGYCYIKLPNEKFLKWHYES